MLLDWSDLTSAMQKFLMETTGFPRQICRHRQHSGLGRFDAGVSVYRDPLNPEELVVTARPQGLRRTDGRHAGYHSGLGWTGLAKGLNTRALP